MFTCTSILFRRTLLVVAVGLAAVPACSSSGTTEATKKACTAYTVPEGTDLTTPAVSFQLDVMPIFQNRSESACHGSSRVPVLGVAVGVGDPQKLRANVVDVASVALPAMAYVKAGDAANSFLMHKLDGDACVNDKECTNGTCGDSMPDEGTILDVTVRDTVRRWIAQGAKDN